MRRRVSDHAEDRPKLVIVCGPGRSGTSLMHAMISAHPDVVGVPETGMLRRILSTSTRSWDERSMREWIGSTPRLQRFRLSEVEIAWALNTALSTSAIAPPVTFYHSVLGLLARRGRRGIVVDKDPRLLETASLLLKSKRIVAIVVMARDPRDVFTSRLRAEWSARRGRVGNIVATATQAAATRELDQTNPKVVVIRFEDLVTDPRRYLHQVCGVIGLPFSEMMLREFPSAAEVLTSPQELQWKGRALKELDPDRVGVWKADGTAERKWLKLLELLCLRYCSEFRYEREFTQRSHGLDWVGRLALTVSRLPVSSARASARSLLS